MKGLKVKDEDNDNEFMFAVKTKKVEQKKDDAQTEKVVVTDLGFKVTPPERAREDRAPRRDGPSTRSGAAGGGGGRGSGGGRGGGSRPSTGGGRGSGAGRGGGPGLKAAIDDKDAFPSL